MAEQEARRKDIATAVGFRCLSILQITPDQAVALGAEHLIELVKVRLEHHANETKTLVINKNNLDNNNGNVTINYGLQLDLETLARLIKQNVT